MKDAWLFVCIWAKKSLAQELHQTYS